MDNNEAVARRFFDDVWTGGRYEAADALLASNHQHHISGQTIVGPEAVKQMARGLRGAFPDLEFVIEDTIVEGDKVVVRWAAHGTHTGPFGELTATGRRVEWTGIDLIHLADGRIVELWGNNDALGLVDQLS
jgi:steroid delta-isomerase-like uncharacterized protein